MMAGKPTLQEIEEAEKKPLWKRLGWLAGIWAGSVLALFVVASLMRMFMNAAGLTTH
ncbi:Cytochrome d ubiquinol oxidase subunit X [Pseudomonas chlororaphis]|nr:Cytochrome d ubiquinol oxidase subunit X [Pseudomonas chlororaphis]